MVITFWPHPRFVLNPDSDSLKLLSTFEEKAQLLEDAGIDYLVKIPFTREFSQLTSEQFIRKILMNKIGVTHLVIGYDHRFGKNREGSFDYLKSNASEFGFDVEEIPRQDIDHVGVSSTKIRNALLEGAVHSANEYLGRSYELTGTVTHGQKIGTDIGFPTANVAVKEKYKLIPRDGVYAVEVKVKGQQFHGMMNIGVRPTVDGVNRAIEVHIFDFDEDIYHEQVTINFIRRIRNEQKFNSLDELKQRLENDKVHAIELLSR